jgi:lysophosphatidylcholine acyltransferase/lyso-PAF acetyltransferase
MEALEIIKERQMLAEQGKTPPILIYPEGATTNGEALVYFAKGAFASLRPVQPILIKYWTLNNIKASQDVLGISNHLNVIGTAIAIT